MHFFNGVGKIEIKHLENIDLDFFNKLLLNFDISEISVLVGLGRLVCLVFQFGMME